MAGTLGRVYGGDPSLVHVPDGNRTAVGKAVAFATDNAMRVMAFEYGLKDHTQAATQELCPGCYMVVGFNALVELAKMNGQSYKELGLTMAAAFTKLAECDKESVDVCIEEIAIILDPPEICPLAKGDG